MNIVDQSIPCVEGLLLFCSADAKQFSYNSVLCYSFTAQASSVTFPCK